MSFFVPTLSSSPSAQTQPLPTGAADVSVRWILRAEGLALFAVALLAYAHEGLGWGRFALLFLAPDLTFAAYALGPRWGAAAYNALHTTLFPAALGVAAFALASTDLAGLALIALAHVGFDRALGYGLKYPTGFNDTHLGRKGGKA